MGERIGGALAAGLARVTGFLPALLSAVVIAVVGYVLSRVAGAICTRLLARLGFDRLAERHVHPTQPLRGGASKGVGGIVFALGLLTTAILTADALGLHALARVLAYVPRALVALVIFASAVAVGNVIARLLSGTSARAAQIGVVVLGCFMALDELGVARGIVMTLFAAVVGAAAVAAAIAFGVGGIPAARDRASRWANRVDGALDGPAATQLPPRTSAEPPQIIPH